MGTWSFIEVMQGLLVSTKVRVPSEDVNAARSNTFIMNEHGEGRGKIAD